MLSEKQVPATRFSIFYSNNSVIFRKEVGNGFSPFDDDDVGGVGEVFGEVVSHEAGVGKTIKVVVDEIAALR